MQVVCDEIRCPGNRNGLKKNRDDLKDHVQVMCSEICCPCNRDSSSSRNSQHEIDEGKMSVSWMETEQEKEHWQQIKA